MIRHLPAPKSVIGGVHFAFGGGAKFVGAIEVSILAISNLVRIDSYEHQVYGKAAMFPPATE